MCSFWIHNILEIWKKIFVNFSSKKLGQSLFPPHVLGNLSDKILYVNENERCWGKKEGRNDKPNFPISKYNFDRCKIWMAGNVFRSLFVKGSCHSTKICKTYALNNLTWQVKKTTLCISLVAFLLPSYLIRNICIYGVPTIF